LEIIRTFMGVGDNVPMCTRVDGKPLSLEAKGNQMACFCAVLYP
jgi:hypothetical protein